MSDSSQDPGKIPGVGRRLKNITKKAMMVMRAMEGFIERHKLKKDKKREIARNKLKKALEAMRIMNTVGRALCNQTPCDMSNTYCCSRRRSYNKLETRFSELQRTDDIHHNENHGWEDAGKPHGLYNFEIAKAHYKSQAFNDKEYLCSICFLEVIIPPVVSDNNTTDLRPLFFCTGKEGCGSAYHQKCIDDLSEHSATQNKFPLCPNCRCALEYQKKEEPLDYSFFEKFLNNTL